MMKSFDNGYTWENAGEPPFFPEYTFIRGTIEDQCRGGNKGGRANEKTSKSGATGARSYPKNGRKKKK